VGVSHWEVNIAFTSNITSYRRLSCCKTRHTLVDLHWYCKHIVHVCECTHPTPRTWLTHHHSVSGFLSCSYYILKSTLFQTRTLPLNLSFTNAPVHFNTSCIKAGSSTFPRPAQVNAKPTHQLCWLVLSATNDAHYRMLLATTSTVTLLYQHQSHQSDACLCLLLPHVFNLC
jgi:hypothetical protein